MIKLILKIAILSIITTLFILLIVDWIIHISQTKCFSKHYGYGSFKDFRKQFQKYNWSNDNVFRYGLWDRENKCEFHASIVKFNDIGMILKNPIDWLLVRIFVFKYVKNNFIEKPFDWSKVK